MYKKFDFTGLLSIVPTLSPLVYDQQDDEKKIQEQTSSNVEE
jgi:uncharacterized membrane protein